MTDIIEIQECMIDGTPRDVLDAVGRLACSICVVVNVGVNREDLSRAHVTYFCDEDICFARLGFPHMEFRLCACENRGDSQGSCEEPYETIQNSLSLA